VPDSDVKIIAGILQTMWNPAWQFDATVPGWATAAYLMALVTQPTGPWHLLVAPPL
jgi:hypothetical protein